MDILIAILWYLNLLIPGQEYTTNEIDTLMIENQAAIESVQSSSQLTNDALNYYDQTWDGGQVGIIEEWEENPIKPIHD